MTMSSGIDGKGKKAISSTSDGRKREKSGAEAQQKKAKAKGKSSSSSSRKLLGLKKDKIHKKSKMTSAEIERARRKDPYADFRQYPTGELADLDLIHKYIRQIESGGFDVDVYPGDCFAAMYIPRDDFKEPGQFQRDIIEMSKLALARFNTDNKESKGVPYEFEGIERVVSYGCSGEVFLITFQARGAETDDIKTFQAEVYDPTDVDDEAEWEVMLVRLKEL